LSLFLVQPWGANLEMDDETLTIVVHGINCS